MQSITDCVRALALQQEELELARLRSLGENGRVADAAGSSSSSAAVLAAGAQAGPRLFVNSPPTERLLGELLRDDPAALRSLGVAAPPSPSERETTAETVVAAPTCFSEAGLEFSPPTSSAALGRENAGVSEAPFSSNGAFECPLAATSTNASSLLSAETPGEHSPSLSAQTREQRPSTAAQRRLRVNLSAAGREASCSGIALAEPLEQPASERGLLPSSRSSASGALSWEAGRAAEERREANLLSGALLLAPLEASSPCVSSEVGGESVSASFPSQASVLPPNCRLAAPGGGNSQPQWKETEGAFASLSSQLSASSRALMRDAAAERAAPPCIRREEGTLGAAAAAGQSTTTSGFANFELRETLAGGASPASSFGVSSCGGEVLQQRCSEPVNFAALRGAGTSGWPTGGESPGSRSRLPPAWERLALLPDSLSAGAGSAGSTGVSGKLRVSAEARRHPTQGLPFAAPSPSPLHCNKVSQPGDRGMLLLPPPAAPQRRTNSLPPPLPRVRQWLLGKASPEAAERERSQRALLLLPEEKGKAGFSGGGAAVVASPPAQRSVVQSSFCSSSSSSLSHQEQQLRVDVQIAQFLTNTAATAPAAAGRFSSASLPCVSETQTPHPLTRAFFAASSTAPPTHPPLRETPTAGAERSAVYVHPPPMQTGVAMRGARGSRVASAFLAEAENWIHG